MKLKIFLLVGIIFISGYVIFVYAANPLSTFSGNFFEGFESGSLVTNNWTTSGVGVAWTIGDGGEATPRTGTYDIWVENTDGESVIETGISTIGYQNITFSFYYQTRGHDGGEYFAADYFNGTAWVNVLERIEQMDWDNWTFFNTTLGSGANNNANFKIRFRCSTNSNNEDCEVDDINVTGRKLSPTITFLSQFPADMDSLNAEMNNDVNITYNITDSIGINASTVFIYDKSNSTLEDTAYYINGTAISGYQAHNGTNVSSTWEFSIPHHHIYPASYNIDSDIMETTPHNSGIINSTRKVKVTFFNISNTRQYNFLEVMANTSSLTNSLKFYYCNSSYTTGSVLITSPNCFDFYTLEPTATYNHSHSAYQSHQLIPIAINTTSGNIGTVKVTPTSQIIMRVIDGNWTYYSIPNISRTDTTQISTDLGVSWQNELSTVDIHFHQFSGADSFYSYVCANNTLNAQTCSAVRQDLFQLAGLPPIAPSIYNPLLGNYSGNINIMHYPSLSPNNYAISYYNISLLNSDETFNKTIIENNSLNLSYSWNSLEVANGSYIIRVEACDVNGFCSFGISEIFTINNAPDTCTYTSGNWIVNCADNCSISSNVNLLGNDIFITGYGSFSTTANITNFESLYVAGTSSVNRCEVYCLGGGCFG